MDNIIKQKISDIERKFNVKVILAVESGSRAWGFPSINSDYDVRFVYVNKPGWYVSIAQKKDTIELPISDYLDINGWDIIKAFKLLRKSNSPLQEWISSPIVYASYREEIKEIEKLAKVSFMPESSFYHYLSMAKKRFTSFQDKKRVKIKDYMYVIRSVFCCEHIITYNTQPPMKISELLSDLNDDSIKNEIIRLIDIKFENSEKFEIPRSDFIEEFLNKKIINLSEVSISNPKKAKTEIYDKILRRMIKKAWKEKKLFALQKMIRL